MSIFGYDYQRSATSAVDIRPIVKYDARAGRIFRVDRTQDQVNGNWITENIDITNSFKALADFENIETGWIDFAAGMVPSLVMVPRGETLPAKPSDNHRFGIRFNLKLAKHCGGDSPIREIAGTSRMFLDGTGLVVEQYLKEAPQHPGQLPVIVLVNTMPVTTGSGMKSSTNYQPTWQIVGWAPRGDLQPKPRAAPAQAQTQAQGNGQSLPYSSGIMAQSRTAPATGSSRAAPPPQSTAPAVSPDDF